MKSKCVLVLGAVLVIVPPGVGQSTDAKTKAFVEGLVLQHEALETLLESSTLHCVLGTGHTAEWNEI